MTCGDFSISIRGCSAERIGSNYVPKMTTGCHRIVKGCNKCLETGGRPFRGA